MDQRAAKRTGATIPNCPSQSVVLKAAARRFVLCCAARLNAWCCIVTCRHAGMPGRQYVCSPAFACVLTVCLQLHSGPAATPPPSMRTVIMVLNYSNKHNRNGFPTEQASSCQHWDGQPCPSAKLLPHRFPRAPPARAERLTQAAVRWSRMLRTARQVRRRGRDTGRERASVCT